MHAIVAEPLTNHLILRLRRKALFLRINFMRIFSSVDKPKEFGHTHIPFLGVMAPVMLGAGE